MNDTVESFTQERPVPRRWLLLFHQIPPKPDYLRVKVRRRLQRLGAVALKNSVYALPAGDDRIEDFEWLLQEIRQDGGEATLCEATLVAGLSDAALEATFRAERDADYRAIAEAAREPGADAARLRRRLEEVGDVDFFDAAGRAEAERAVAAIGTGAAPTSETGAVRGATWVTRTGVFIDRIASTWLIRRFIDPAARFKFVAARGYRPMEGELRFDMYEGEYGHEGERCTFETLLARFGLDDPALRVIGEIVHDIDCKDDRFGRPETAGVAAVIGGIARVHGGDAERIAAGAAVMDGLYVHLSGGQGGF